MNVIHVIYFIFRIDSPDENMSSPRQADEPKIGPSMESCWLKISYQVIKENIMLQKILNGH